LKDFQTSLLLPMNAIFVTERSKSCRKKNAQFFECKRENLPLVVITPGRTYATVEIDMITTNRNLDKKAVEDICKVFAQNTSDWIWRSRVACRAERIPKGCAENVATEIYEIASTAMPRLRKIGT